MRRLDGLDRLAAALLGCGLVALATGALPTDRAGDAMTRIVPLLGFLGTVVVLAELTRRAEVFDAAATGVARAARGSYPALFGLCVLFSSVTTIALNLDTTAVLLTPVMLALAGRVGIAPVPLAMTTVWLANTASLLLPVSNLTNLLAADRVSLSPTEMAARMWAPQLATLAVTMLCLWGFFWRRGRRDAATYEPPARFRAADPVLLRLCAVACVGFLVAVLLAELPLWAVSTAAAVAVVAAFAVRDREALRLSLVPWRLLVLVPGMFLVVETANAHGLHGFLVSAVGDEGGFTGMLRTAGVGAGLSNALNNLPVYVAGESAVPTGHHDQLLALLIGTNVGATVTPWASLATLLWFERCHWHGTPVPLRRFMATGLVLAVGCVVAATGTYALVH
ncbi:SLC13 family permease [Streptomyces sp. NPDC054784]